MPGIGSALKATLSAARNVARSPVKSLGASGALGLGGEAALLTADVGVPAATGLFTDPLGRRIREEFGRQDVLVARAARARRLARLQAENELLLAQRRPDLYSAVLAGRKLPRGAVVLGGTPRRDLMDELVQAMTEGRFTSPSPGDADLARLLER